ncbi:MAG: chloride channel protein [Gemmatimonadaceae bacterium]
MKRSGRFSDLSFPWLLADGGHRTPGFARETRRQRQLVIDAIILGVVGALAAQLFIHMVSCANALFLYYLAGYRSPGLPTEYRDLTQLIGRFGLWLIPAATTLGGLIVGIMVQGLAPEAEGHGTDTVIRAYHQHDGILRGRVAPVKMVASAITIGSGGAAGREGPVALITAGVGSWYGSRTGRDAEDRRMLLLIGMAAGLSAIFRSPIGTAIMAVEVLYSDMEFERDALLYTMLGSIVAYAVNGMIVGWQPLFQMPSAIAPLSSPLAYGWYVVLGLAAGVLGTVLPAVFYGLRDWFKSLPIRSFLRPALGGLLTGLIALAYPQVIGGGYGWMQQAINGQLLLGTLAVLVFGKILALSFSVASGGSGGVFAPSLFVGAMLGGVFAMVLHQPAAPFVVVGMAAVFAGAAHLPVATLFMVSEMTGGYALLVPAGLAVMISYLVQTRLSSRLKYRSIYEAQVPNRGESPAHRRQQLQTALRVLRRQGLPDLSTIGELDLFTLIKSGLPVELPGGLQLLAGTLRPASSIVGCTVADAVQRLQAPGTKVLAIVREETFVVPAPDSVLVAGDRLMLVAEASAVDDVRRHLTAW